MHGFGDLRYVITACISSGCTKSVSFFLGLMISEVFGGIVSGGRGKISEGIDLTLFVS